LVSTSTQNTKWLSPLNGKLNSYISWTIGKSIHYNIPCPGKDRFNAFPYNDTRKRQNHLKYVLPVHCAFHRQVSSLAQHQTPSSRKNKYLE
jgi:hypothetical protein